MGEADVIGKLLPPKLMGQTWNDVWRTSLLVNVPKIQLLYFPSCPRRLAEELQA